MGGVRKSRWREAPPLQEVAARVSQEIQGKILVGHGLQGDLEALGLIHPRHLKRDTMTFRKFQSKGHARKLSCLAADLLGKDIQVYRHSARCVLASSSIRLAATFVAPTNIITLITDQTICQMRVKISMQCAGRMPRQPCSSI